MLAKYKSILQRSISELGLDVLYQGMRADMNRTSDIDRSPLLARRIKGQNSYKYS